MPGASLPGEFHLPAKRRDVVLLLHRRFPIVSRERVAR